MRSVLTLVVVFTLIARCNAQLTVLSPNGAEVFNVGQSVTLRWSGTSFPDSVLIEYSTNAGATWTEIVRNWQQTSYRWIVPNTPSTQCLLRVTGPTRTTGSGVVQLRDASRPQPVSHNSIDLTRNGTQAIVADDSGYVMLFNAVSGALLAKNRIQGDLPQGARVVRAVLSDDETWLAALTEEDTVFILSVPSLAVIDRWPTQIGKRVPLEDRWIATQPGGSRVAVSSFTRSRVFERNGTVVAELGQIFNESNTCIDWTPDGREVVVGSNNTGHVRADANTGTTVLTYPAPAFYGFVSPSGQNLASQAKNTQAVLIRDLATGATVGTVASAPGLLPFGIAWLPNNTVVRCTGPFGGTLEHYTVSGTLIDTLTTQPFPLGGPTFDATGSVIGAVSAGFSAVIRTAAAPTPLQDVSDAIWEIRTVVAPDTATLTIDSVSSTTLQDVRVPIRLAPSNATILNGVSALTVDVAWNATMAVEYGGTAAGSTLNGTRSVTLTLPVQPITADIVGYLDLRTALGNDSVTVLRITDVRGVTDPARIKRDDGALVLSDVCRSGGPRFVNGDGVASLMGRGIGPDVELRWTTIEDGMHEITVFDMMGRIVERLQMEARAGSYTTIMNVRALHAGPCFVMLRTPTITLRCMTEVVR